ncbi:MAG: lipoprotein insertase outer membrane protein LolB [Steroidobacteraceae bacterium]
MRSLGALLACLAFGLLAGCAVQPALPTAVLDAGAQRTLLAGLQRFSFEGRVAATSETGGAQATLAWEQQGGESLLRLSGPLGLGATRVRLGAGALSITTSRGEQLEGDAALAALGTQVGIQPPLAQLRYWVLGLPAPDSVAEESLDAGGRLAGLAQQGWTVSFNEYRAQRLPQGQVQLPRRLTASHADLRLRMVIDKWNLQP